MGHPEDLFELHPAIVENAVQILRYQQTLNERAAENRIVNGILHEGATVTGFESVFVDPGPIRAAALLVDKAKRRIPCRDFALPAHRQPVDAKLVVDLCPELDHFGPGNHLEVEPLRSNAFEVAG